MSVRLPWGAYAIEAGLLGAFMLAAATATVVIEHPASAVRVLLVSAAWRRALVGVAMGATAIGLIHSPWGQRSGAHMNPAVTLAFWWLGRIGTADALGYAAGQLVGGTAGVGFAYAALGSALAHPSVRFVVTVPGAMGVGAAFVAETLISFAMMAMVLITSAAPRWSRYTGRLSGLLVALYILLEAPWSGMSMNPARTIASAAWAGEWSAWWLYCTAPCLGMITAAVVVPARTAAREAACPSLHHRAGRRCLFCRLRAGLP